MAALGGIEQGACYRIRKEARRTTPKGDKPSWLNVEPWYVLKPSQHTAEYGPVNGKVEVAPLFVKQTFPATSFVFNSGMIQDALGGWFIMFAGDSKQSVGTVFVYLHEIERI
jgi:hypothetical protein